MSLGRKMSDSKEDESSTFSFRTFDIYRRIVNVLQLYPKIFEEFKNGSPTEETCRIVVQKMFQFYQSQERITQLTTYMCRNANLMVLHAMETPPLWNAAISYTECYIKKIRKYLKKKKKVIDNLDYNHEVLINLAKEIGIHIHENPSEKQIEDIREYLKYDLNNPKSMIVSITISEK